MAIGRTVAGEIMRRSAPIPTPLRRGAAAVVATGGALTLAGLAATVPAQVDAKVVAAAVVLPVTDPLSPTATDESTDVADSTTLVPVRADTAAPATEKLDTASLVKAVQLAERTLTGRATTTAAAPLPDPKDASKPGGSTGAPKGPEANDAGRDDQAPASTGDATAGDTAPDGAARKDEADASQRADQSATGAPTSAKAAPTDCGLNTGGLGRVKPHVRAAAAFLGCRFGEPEMFGVAGRGGTSDHPGGLAVDFMVNRSTGNALAECVLSNQDALGVSYVIWRQRINFGSGWKLMADRGGATANHEDHVHVSFESRAGGSPRGC